MVKEGNMSFTVGYAVQLFFVLNLIVCIINATDTTILLSTSQTKTYEASNNENRPFPDPESKIPVIVQEAAKWIPELKQIISESGSPNTTQLWEIYQYVQSSLKLENTPKSIQSLFKDLEASGLFDILKTTPIVNTTTTTTPNPFSVLWEQCREDVETMVTGLKNNEVWAWRMIDASGKPGHSILEGNRRFVGNYRECTSAHQSHPKVNHSGVAAIVCRVTFDLKIGLPENPRWNRQRFEWDVCVPKSCHDSDLKHVANQSLSDISQISNVNVICTTDFSMSNDASAIIALCILVILCILVAIGTLLDLLLAIDQTDEDNSYFINGYDAETSAVFNEGFELREKETSLSTPVNKQHQRTSRIEELKESIDAELQHVVLNGRSRSFHQSIGLPMMGLHRQSLGMNANNNTDTDKEKIISSIINTHGMKVNPSYMPGEHSTDVSDAESVGEFSPGEIADDDENKTQTERKKDETHLLPLWQQALLAFSVPRNMKKILSVKSLPGSIKCLHGIRVLSMAWIILGHTYMAARNSQNPALPYGLLSTLRGQILISWTYALDSFFVLSGVLTAYWFMNECGKKRQVSAKTGIKYYVHRFWRLTPPYILWIMIEASLMTYLGTNQPGWIEYRHAQACKEKWWINLLYINNIYKNNDQCHPTASYLANDMQFHVFAPLALIPLVYGFKVIGMLVCGLLIALHLASTAWLQYDMGSGDQLRNRYEFNHDIDMQPYTRVAPYAIGLIAGWCLWKWKSKLKFNKYANLIGWLLCLCATFILPLVTFDENKDLKEDRWPSVGRIVFQTICRPIWGLLVAWIAVACATGNGGFINGFLSWNGWLVVSRLTYSVYLVHVTVMTFEEAAVESAVFFSETVMVYRFFGYFMMSYLVGLILSLVVGSPMIALEEMAFPRNKKKRI